MEEAKAVHNRVDEDGWTVVARTNRRNTNTNGGITVTAAKADYTVQVDPKKHQIDDFYRFQLKHNKHDKLVDLRKRFEEDKSKMEHLRASRRFKPY
jgi:ribosomal RNA-processing protein 7